DGVQRGRVPILVKTFDFEAQVQPVGAEARALESGPQTGKRLGQFISVADHTGGNPIRAEIDPGIRLGRKSLARMIGQLRNIDIETLVARAFDLESYRDV